MADVRNIEGLRWLAEVQGSDAAKWALEQLDWRTMETAPRGGTRIIAKDQVGYVGVVEFGNDVWIDESGDIPDWDLVAWRPL